MSKPRETTVIDTKAGLIAWFARNHVAANLLMLVIIVAGLASALQMRIQVNPNIEPNNIRIEVLYPGASPGEVESAVVARIEESLRDVKGIEEMRSFAREGRGSINLSIESDYDPQVAMDEVKLAIDRVAALPAESERPIISRSFKQTSAVNVQIYGDLDERGMKMLAQQVRGEILNLPSVTKAELAGARNYQVSIEVTEVSLRQYGLTLSDVAQAIRVSSVDLGAGSIRTDVGDILLRTQGQAHVATDFESLVLLTSADGTRLTLGDIAVVNDGFVDQRFFSLFNGKPSIGVSVSAVGEQNQIEISREVKAYIAERKKTLPPGINMDTWRDSTEFLSSTLNVMLSNMMFGIVLVIVVLGMFLRFQLAFWVMLGIPIAFLGAFALLPLTGGSINMISLFGFILVLGLVVDDAIIIGESVQTALEDEGYSVDSVIRGARKVAVPATFGVLTTIATFTPLLFVPGSFGALPAALGWVVVLCLVFSIIESKLILPAHLTSLKPLRDHGDSGALARAQQRFSLGFRRLIRQYYPPLLERAIKRRYLTTSVFVAMLIVAIGIVASPYIRTVMFPDISSDSISARVEMPEGTSSAQTGKVVREVTDKLVMLNDERPEAEKFLLNFNAYTYDTNGNINVELVSGDHIVPTEVAEAWRNAVGEIVGTRKLEFSGAEKSHGGRGDLSFKLIGSEPQVLKAAADYLQQHLRTYDGVYQVENSAEGSIPEMNINIKPNGEALGLTLGALAQQVRSAFYGVEAQRLQRNSEEIRVLVRYPESDRNSLGNLESMYVRAPTGELIPFSAVAEIDERVSPSVITRIDGDGSVEVSAGVDFSVVRPADIVRDIDSVAFRRELASRFPGVRLEMGGATELERELLLGILYGGALGLFAVYALMAIPLKSYVQPLIILGVIPFGMIGAMIGHLLIGIPFSALSLFGLVALAGVVVNDSIIMVDSINQYVAAGVRVKDAVIRSGVERFRAIVLTSLTTFFGLMPILLETSVTAQIVIPMAISLAFGILFATIITLVLIPCLYLILDDLKHLRERSGLLFSESH
jgi:multidrug efflux pump subunit AcrB